jgi:YD repeat-containing protein
MESTARVRAVAVSREAVVAQFFWRSPVTVAIALALMLAAAGLAHAQSNWVRPAPPLVGYVGSSPAPHLCQRTFPLDEGCWLGLDPQRAIDQVCALHGDVRAPGAQLPAGEKLFTAEVQCAGAKVGIAGQPFYCDSSGRVEARFVDPRTGAARFSCTPPPSVADAYKNMGCRGCDAARAGGGVNPEVGNAYRYEADFRSADYPLLEISRLYNSMDARPRAFGFNWVGYYERRLEVYPGLRVVAWRADANIYYFDQARGRFIADAGIQDSLVKVAGGKSGVAWRYTAAADHVVEEYDAHGVLIAMRHPGGVKVRLEYSDAATPAERAPGAGYLLRVVDNAGLSVRFSYDREGRIVRAGDPRGHSYAYNYGEASGCRTPAGGAAPCAGGNLTSVVAQGGGSRTYHYDQADGAPVSLPRALTGISSTDGAIQASWVYDLNGAAVGANGQGEARRVTLE